MKNNETKHRCPEIPFFGPHYPDARCINGYLWDLDSDENGVLTQGGEIPCPFCNTEEFIEYDPFMKKRSLYNRVCGIDEPTIEQDKEANERARDWYLGYINKMREQYGVVSSR